jgi:hypothetical protein
MLTVAKDVGLFVMLIVVTSVIAGLPVGALGRVCHWPIDRCKKRVLWTLVGVCLFWWCWTHWVSRVTTPVEWLGHDLGPVVQSFGFVGWLLLSRLLAIRIVSTIAGFSTVASR